MLLGWDLFPFSHFFLFVNYNNNSLVTEESLQPVIWWRPGCYWQQRAAACSSRQCLTSRQNKWGCCVWVWGLLCWHVPVGPSSTDLICDPHSVIYNRNLPIKTSILNTLDHCFVFSVWDLAWRALRRVMVLIFPQKKCLGVHLALSENSVEIPLRAVLSYWSDLNKGIWLSQVIFVMLEGNLWRTLIKCRYTMCGEGIWWTNRE